MTTLLAAAGVAVEVAGGRRILDGIDLAVPPRALVGLLGPNGAGKTTLIRVLGGVLAPTSGRVTLTSRDLGSLGREVIARQIALVPQETHPAFDYTVLEVALMGRYPHLGAFQIEGPGDLAIVHQALAATRTESLATRAFATLSGGEKQRVAIASALAQLAPGPEAQASPHSILLLDEPTSALDLRAQVELLGLLTDLNRDLGVTIVVSTHDLHFAAGLCRELVLLKHGRILDRGPTGDALSSANVRRLYDVDADVMRHDASGQVTVIPFGIADRSGDRAP